MLETVVMETAAVLAAEKNRTSVVREEQELEREYALEAAEQEKAIRLAKANGGCTSVRDARLMMGPKNFIGLDSIIPAFGLEGSSDAVSRLGMVHYPEEMLWKLRNSHRLVAGVSVDFIQVRQALSKKKALRGDFSYDEEPFANRKMAVRWYLVSKDIARNSLFRTKAEQDARIFADPVHERLGALETAYIVAACRLIVKQPMLQDVAALTSDSIVTLERTEKAEEVAAFGTVTGQRLSRSFTSLVSRRGVSSEWRRREWGVYVGFNSEFGIGVGTCSADEPMANIGAIVSVRPTLPIEEADEE